MEAKNFEKLPEKAKMIRTKVFMEEQGFENEFDENDNVSIHIVLFDSSNPVATCRFGRKTMLCNWQDCGSKGVSRKECRQ